ncbi:SLC13 family permease [Nannocystis exedens]|uniref:SLC13 family permease n=1 Tax=Nannocystis exedens TaxID=54 RepID=UPI000BD7E719|nr:SLC13 family permease [Nannocystis exedens]PCC68831.1 Sodium-dependent dicarboxylate transporter SdcS [Nannocystis exedens]
MREISQTQPKDSATSTSRSVRGIAGGILAPLAFAALWLAPLPLEPRAHHLVAIFAAVLIAWVSEVVPVAVTALMVAPLLVVCGVTDAASAFRHYADPLLFLFVGGFMLAASMQRHGLDRRFAWAVITLPFVRGVWWRTRLAIVAAATLMSIWISNTATCAIFVPILLGLPAMARSDAKIDPATAPLLALAYVCSTGGLGTLVGTPPNGITVRHLANAGVEFGFVEWLAIGVPSAIVLSIAATLITTRGPPNASEEQTAVPPPLGPWSRGELVTVLCFATAILGWTLPAIVEAIGLPFARDLNARLPPGAVAVLACLPLFLVPDPARREGAEAVPPVLPWSTAVRIDWGVILLFGGGIALGAQLEDTGLASALAEGIVKATGATDVWTLSAIACLTTIVLSEVASNTAAANILVPLVIALAREFAVSPIPPALAVGIGASVGFMLPIATAPNALVYATGRVPQGSMMRVGLLLDLACFVLVMLLIRVICPLMDWV